MKNSTLKILVLCAVSFLSYQAKAQTYYAPSTNLTKDISVDTDPSNGGASPDGTIGSWYQWVSDNSSVITASDSPNNPAANDGNKATITWNATWPTNFADATQLIKDYNIKATEFNTCDSTTGDNTEINVKLVKADVLHVESDSSICGTSPATITIYGTPNSTINYTVSGTDFNAPVTTDNDGKAEIQIIPNGTGDIVFTIDDITYANTQPDSTPFTISEVGANFTLTSNIITVEVGTSPQISPISF